MDRSELIHELTYIEDELSVSDDLVDIRVRQTILFLRGCLLGEHYQPIEELGHVIARMAMEIIKELTARDN